MGRERQQETIGGPKTTSQERDNQRITDKRVRGRRPHAKSPKARSGKELVRCVQYEAVDEGAPKDKGRTHDEPPHIIMPYPPPLGTTCIGEFIACFITIAFIPSSPLPLHEPDTEVLMWSPALPILLDMVKSEIAFDNS